MIFTPPPLRIEATKPEYADRAGEFVRFMTDPSFTKHTSNVFVFDLFNLLVDPNSNNKNIL